MISASAIAMIGGSNVQTVAVMSIPYFPLIRQTYRVRNSILFYMDLTGFTSANPVFRPKDILLQLAMV